MVTTISVSEEVKKLLESLKGYKDWNSFLKELVEEYLAMKREVARRELKDLLVRDYKEVRIKGWAREY